MALLPGSASANLKTIAPEHTAHRDAAMAASRSFVATLIPFGVAEVLLSEFRSTCGMHHDELPVHSSECLGAAVECSSHVLALVRRI